MPIGEGLNLRTRDVQVHPGLVRLPGSAAAWCEWSERARSGPTVVSHLTPPLDACGYLAAVKTTQAREGDAEFEDRRE